MKKILLIALALALVLSLCAGCNNSRRIEVDDDDFDDEPIVIDASNTSDNDTNDDDDQPHIDLPGGWPAYFPLYTDGTIYQIIPKEYDCYTITINKTSKAAVEEYAVTLTNAGWECIVIDDVDEADAAIVIEFSKDDQRGSLILAEDEYLLVINLRRVLESEELPNVWPADHLPQGFPVYPDGEITGVSLNESGMIFIIIEGSGKGTFDKYAATLKDAGWEFERFGDDEPFEYEGVVYDYEMWKIEKDGIFGSLVYSELSGMVNISI